MDDLESDTANVLLTLARIWRTLTTREFVGKDEASEWAIARLPDRHRSALDRARDVYLGETDDDWRHLEREAREAAHAVRAEISRIWTAKGD